MNTLYKSPNKLILASSSKYRCNLLKNLKLNFEIIIPNVDETTFFNQSPKKLSLILSKAKAIAVQKKILYDAIIIGSDQIGVCDNHIIGKSCNFEKAKLQLEFLSNKLIKFYTSITVIHGNIHQCATVLTTCKIKKLTNKEIENYLNLESPYDIAGSIKTEGLGIALMEKIESDDPTAIIGLPLIKLINILNNFGVNLI